MKELRPPSSGTTEIRLLFAFDPRREAICLVAGDKAGNWDGWYRQAIPLADERFTEHLIELEAEEPKKRRAAATPSGVMSRLRAARLTRGPPKSRLPARPQPASTGTHTCADTSWPRCAPPPG